MLIVDDEVELVELLLAYLSSKGIVARGLTKSADYMSDIRGRMPRIVLLDVSMPGADGYQLCSDIKHDPEMARVKVILLTGRPLADVIKNVEICGADEYLLKPFTLPDLDRAVMAPDPALDR